jgi:hypothetical protein
MVKTLYCGDILDEEAWTILLDRLSDLQKSSSGPFDLLFFTGKLFLNFAASDSGDRNPSFEKIIQRLDGIKIKFYAFQYLQDFTDPTTAANIEKLKTLKKDVLEVISGMLGFHHTDHNLTLSYYFQSKLKEKSDKPSVMNSEEVNLDEDEIDETDSLEIMQHQEEYKQTLLFQKTTENFSYRGVDIFITDTWPKDAEVHLPSEQKNELYNCGLKFFHHSSSKLSEITNQVKPRYFFFSGLNAFYQRSPFIISEATQGMIPASPPSQAENRSTSIYCRLISLDKVSKRKEKNHKYLHALSLVPFIFMKPTELEAIPVDATNNPFPRSQPTAVSRGLSGSKHDLSVSEDPPTLDAMPPPAKRGKFQSGSSELYNSFVPKSGSGGPGAQGQMMHGGQDPSNNPGAFFFGQQNASRNSRQVNISNAGNEGNVTLFVGGIGKEHFQLTDDQLSNIFGSSVKKIKKYHDKPYAFIEMASHQEAKDIVSRYNGQSFKIFAKSLTVGWATTANSGASDAGSVVSGDRRGGAPMGNINKLLIPPNSTCRTLYIGNLPNGTVTDPEAMKASLTDLFNSVKVPNVPDQSSTLVKGIYYQDSAVNYCFMEFESHELAGSILAHSLNEPSVYSLSDHLLIVKWSTKGRNLSDMSSNSQSKQNASGSGDIILPPWELLQQQPNECRVMFIGNIPETVKTGEDLINFLREEYAFNDFEKAGNARAAPIESVHKPEGREYGFITFSSVQVAYHAMQHCISAVYDNYNRQLSEQNAQDTGSSSEAPKSIVTRWLRFGWAKGRGADREKQSEDCWFCLASPTVKVRKTHA